MHKYGFFSVKQDKHDRYFIRARVRHDLANLCENMQAVLVVDPADPVRVLLTHELPGSVPADVTTAIQDWPNADYRYRLIVSRQALGAIFTMFADSIDYPNFKSEVSKHPDQHRHHALYHEVWRTMTGL